MSGSGPEDRRPEAARRDEPPAAAGGVREHRLLTVLYVLLGLVALYEVLRALGHPGDFPVFLGMGRAALDGRVPYDPAVEATYGTALEGHWATWPPSFAPIAILLLAGDRLAHAPTILLWQLLNMAGLAVVLGFVARWLFDRGLSLFPGPGRMPLLALPMAVALFVPFRLVLSNFEHEQANLLMLGLAAGGFWLLGKGRRAWGGLALGLSTALKATPVLAVPYLAWRGRWRDLGAVAGGAAAAWLFLPALFLGPASLPSWYAGWWRRTRELELVISQLNQSLQATLARIAAGIGPTDPVEVSHRIKVSELGLLGGAEAAPWVLFVLGALGLGALFAYGRPLRRVTRRREALELGVVFAAMGLLSPLGWKWHFVGLVPLAGALFAFTPRGSGGGRRGRPVVAGARARLVYGVLGLAFALVNFTSTGLIGGRASDAFELAGVVTWSSLAVVATALWVLGSTRGAPATVTAGTPDEDPGAP